MDFFLVTRLFVQSVDFGSFSKAAQANNLQASSVSRHISTLERDLGTALFRRSTRKLLLTDAGEVFYERAVRILAEVEDARRLTRISADEPSGTLRIRSPIEFGRLQLTPLLPEFMVSTPALNVDIVMDDEEGAGDATPFDLIIQFGEPSDTRLFSQKFAQNRYAICCSPIYVERASEPAFPSALRDYNCLTHADINVWRFGSKRSTVDIAVEVTGNFRSNRLEPILQAALAGIGVARLPYWMAGPYLKSGSLVPVLPSYDVNCTDDGIYGLYPERRTVSPKIRTFIDFLTSKIDAPPYWDP